MPRIANSLKLQLMPLNFSLFLIRCGKQNGTYMAVIGADASRVDAGRQTPATESLWRRGGARAEPHRFVREARSAMP